MAKEVKFTFKRGDKPTGLSRVANPYASVTIRLNGKECGTIYPPSHMNGFANWRVSLCVVDPAPENCPWKNISLKAKFDNEAEAREWLVKHTAAILEKHQIYFRDK